MNLSNELTKQVTAHIDEVRKYLGKLPADERQEILQSIESHIYDALQSRSDGEPTPALLDAVIAEMDPPDSCGEVSSIPSKMKKRQLWRVAVPILLLAVLAITGIKLWPKTPPTPVGRWTTVDFVSSVERFDPKIKSWHGSLYLKELTFLPEGKTDRLFWTWKDGVLHHSGDNTDAKFLIKRISGKDYLFLEWITKNSDSQKGIP